MNVAALVGKVWSTIRYPVDLAAVVRVLLTPEPVEPAGVPTADVDSPRRGRHGPPVRGPRGGEVHDHRRRCLSGDREAAPPETAGRPRL